MASQAIEPIDESNRSMVALSTQLEQRQSQYKMVLPSHISPEKFQRTVLTAVTSDPLLLGADRRSLLTACMKCAQDGLLPDKREAALVIFKNRRKDGQGKWVTVSEVQYMPMVYGLRKKILQAAEIKDIYCNIVYKQELESGRFIYEEGSERTLRHKRILDWPDEPSDDDIVVAYSVATFNDGWQSYEVMPRFEINKVRQKSQTGAIGRTVQFGTDKGQPIEPSGPWVDWFAEMAKKTVMRRHSKQLPMSGDLIDIEARDEASAADSTQAVLASQQAAPPLAITDTAPTAKDLAGEKKGEAAGGEEGKQEQSEEDVQRDLDARHDPKTGELIDEEKQQVEDPEPPYKEMMRDWAVRLETASIIGDVLGVEAEFEQHKVAMPEDETAKVDTWIAGAKKGFQK